MLGMLLPMTRRHRRPRQAVASQPVGEGPVAGEKSLIAEIADDATNDLPVQGNVLRHTLAVLYGLCGVLMSGMVGISGTPPILAGLYALGLKAREVVGTSLMVLLAIGITGVLAHSALGAVNWQILLALGIGTVTGAFLGPLLLSRVDTAVLERVYGPFFFILVGLFGLYMLAA